MAVITTNAPSSSRSLSFEVNIASQNIANNTSTLSWRLYGSGGTTTSWVTSGNFKGIIDGTQVYYSSTRINLYNGTQVASGNHTVGHNADGGKSVSLYCEAGIYNVAVNATASGSMGLTQIPRQADITGANDFNDEQNPYFTYSNPAGNAVNNLDACLAVSGSLGSADIGYRAVNKTGNNYSFPLTEAERNVIRNNITTNSKTVRYYLRTIIGGNTFYSTLDRTASIVNANPTFSNFAYRDINSDIVNITGSNQIIIKGKSQVRVDISSANKMVAIKSATAKNYVADMDTRNVSANYSANDLSIDLGTILNAGTKRLNVRAYDSRNNSTLAYKDITVYDYLAPVINASIQRLNDFEAQTTLRVSGTFNPLNINGDNKNTLANTGAVRYRYRETNGTWGAWTNFTYTIDSTGKFNCTDVILNLDNNKSFDFELSCTDKLETTTRSLNVDVGIPAFFISSNKKSIGINCMPPDNAPVGSIYSNGKNIFDLIYPVGAIYMSVNSINPNSLFGGTWVAWGTGKVPVGIDTGQTEFNSVEKTGGDKNLQKHNHGMTSYYDDANYNMGTIPTDNYRYSLPYDAGSITRTQYTNESGTGTGGNLQPYIVCYMWKRTI